MRTLALLLCGTVLSGCSLFGSDFEIDFEVEVLDVRTVQEPGGAVVVCEVVVTATATGQDGELGTFGESDWILRRRTDGSVYLGETRSAAAMAFFFGADKIGAGESIRSAIIENRADTEFDWEFVFFYRKPGGSRGDQALTITCA